MNCWWHVTPLPGWKNGQKPVARGGGSVGSPAARRCWPGTRRAAVRQAIDHLEPTAARVDLARTHLLYGEWLRRQRRRREARIELARPTTCSPRWTRTPSPPGPGPSWRLPASGPQAERGDDTGADPAGSPGRPARRRGRHEPDVAAELFISPATVEYHLRKVYQKLGISSRTQQSQNAYHKVTGGGIAAAATVGDGGPRPRATGGHGAGELGAGGHAVPEHLPQVVVDGAR